MILSFTLSMPNNNSWNGKWTGSKNLYVITRTFLGKIRIKQGEKILKKGYFYYNFDDGWSAGVSIKHVLSKEAAKLRKASNGFCGYDWMVDSIIDKLEIVT